MFHILILFGFVYLLLPLWVCVIRFLRERNSRHYSEVNPFC